MKTIFAIMMCLMLLACNEIQTTAPQISYVTDTLVVTKLDTTVKLDTVIKTDTIVHKDTLTMIKMDTIVHKDTVLHKDTLTMILRDTTIKLDTVVKNDTSIVTHLDTIVRADTVLKINTVTVTKHDTIINNIVNTIIDTVETTVHDTIFSRNLFILDFTQWESGVGYSGYAPNLNLIANTMMNYNNIYNFKTVINGQPAGRAFGGVVVNGVTYGYVPGYVYELKYGNKIIDRYVKGSGGQDSIAMFVDGVLYATGFYISHNTTLTTNQFQMSLIPYNKTYQTYFNYLADGTLSYVHD